MMRRGIVALVLTALAAWSPAMGRSQGMPDPSAMSGVPLPVGDLAVGTVSVRVIRGSFANPVPSLTVELTDGTATTRATTDDAGRAEFSDLTPGARVTASAVVAGQRLESQAFTVPASGGMRLMLVAADSRGDGQLPPAGMLPGQPDTVIIGDETRFVFEMGEDGLSVFYVLQIVNRSNAPVEPDRPLVFELPAEARSATVLDGSAPQAMVAGRELRVAGPIPPGPMIVQLAYTMPLTGPELVIEQPLPALLAHVAVVAQQVGALELASPQIVDQRTMPAQGQLYIAGRGGPVQAGETLRFHFTGVPHHPTWPRNVALALAVLILAAGVWAAVVSGGLRRQKSSARKRLEAERDRLFDELTGLERRHRAGEVDQEHYAVCRRELVSALEDVYAALDEGVALDKAS